MKDKQLTGWAGSGTKAPDSQELILLERLASEEQLNGGIGSGSKTAAYPLK